MLTNLVRRTMLALLVALLVVSMVAPAAFAQEGEDVNEITEIETTTEILVNNTNDQAAEIIQASVSETNVEIVNVIPEGEEGINTNVIIDVVNVESITTQIAQIVQVNVSTTVPTVVSVPTVVDVDVDLDF